jgi:hypothetical protein
MGLQTHRYSCMNPLCPTYGQEQQQALSPDEHMSKYQTNKVICLKCGFEVTYLGPGSVTV